MPVFIGGLSRYGADMPRPPSASKDSAVALFLDLDGTLIEFAKRPDLVAVPGRLLRALEAVHRALDGALALISGRTVADLDALLEPLHLPAAGVHGLEFRNGSGHLHTLAGARIPAWIRERLVSLAGSASGLLLEDKGDSLALHFRQAPELEAKVRHEMQNLMPGLGADFVLQEGKMVLELRPADATKGSAIKLFMAERPFAGRQPVFIGDDVTDEDGFEVVNSMHGVSVRVGPIDHSAARYALPDVSAVLQWLEELVGTERRCDA